MLQQMKRARAYDSEELHKISRKINFENLCAAHLFLTFSVAA
jgi:hypothetical protein